MVFDDTYRDEERLGLDLSTAAAEIHDSMQIRFRAIMKFSGNKEPENAKPNCKGGG
jgi:hypothetical protein